MTTGTTTMVEFITAVRRMRAAQRHYFANRHHHSPKNAILAEQEVDRVLAEMEREHTSQPAPSSGVGALKVAARLSDEGKASLARVWESGRALAVQLSTLSAEESVKLNATLQSIDDLLSRLGELMIVIEVDPVVQTFGQRKNCVMTTPSCAPLKSELFLQTSLPKEAAPCVEQVSSVVEISQTPYEVAGLGTLKALEERLSPDWWRQQFLSGLQGGGLLPSERGLDGE